MRWAITHRPQDLPRSKHTLAEEKTLEDVCLSTDDLIGVTTLSTDNPIGVYAKPESCDEMIDVCLACRNQWIIRT